MRAYGEEIPVTFVDGKQHDFWRVDPGRLRAAGLDARGPAPMAVRQVTCASAGCRSVCSHVHKLLE